MTETALSIIIPTYNGAEKVVRLLQSLGGQTAAAELIVVVDGSTDNTCERLASLASGHASLRIIVQANGGRAAARNRGAAEAESSLLLFLDDDMIAGPGTIARHIEFHQTHANAVLIGSAYRNPDDAQSAFHRYLAGLEQGWRSQSRHGFVDAGNFAFTAAHCSIPAAVFKSIGGFDERLSDCEDFDLGVRLLFGEIPIMHNPRIVAWHGDWPALSTYLRRQKEYSRSVRELLVLRPHYGELFPRFLERPAAGMKQRLVCGAARLCYRQAVSERFPFRALPTRMQQFVFRLIIAAHAGDSD